MPKDRMTEEEFNSAMEALKNIWQACPSDFSILTDDIWEVKKLIHRAKGLILIGDRDCLSCLDEASELLTKKV